MGHTHLTAAPSCPALVGLMLAATDADAAMRGTSWRDLQNKATLSVSPAWCGRAEHLAQQGVPFSVHHSKRHGLKASSFPRGLPVSDKRRADCHGAGGRVGSTKTAHHPGLETGKLGLQPRQRLRAPVASTQAERQCCESACRCWFRPQLTHRSRPASYTASAFWKLPLSSRNAALAS
jgi:hypothetical protein